MKMRWCRGSRKRIATFRIELRKHGHKNIPAITTGMMLFMMRSGRITDMAAIPVPDLAVP
jgi:hypothetical protein